MNKRLLYILLFFLIISICIPEVQAFGAGNIPSFAYLEGKAFRHGDIEDTLADLAKKAGGGGFALGALLGKSKFNGLDIKRVYFGNWLRDYSQAVDIASLKKLQLQSIINLCMVMGFLAHGYATNEFEVTAERLGVYLPVEHMDNPKGYGSGENPRQYDSRLRGPVRPEELEVDPRSGMKNYIANEDGGWDTSRSFVKRTLERCIHFGRQHRSSGQKSDEYEAYRLLGQALHTLEDFSAHSNFCELALLSMGHTQVFCHVGDHVRITARNGKQVPPLVTGSFGSSDFIHSLLGEATDHLSEASVSDLNKELGNARSKNASSPASSVLRELFFSLPGGGGGDMSRDMENIERIRDAPSHGGKRPEDMSPQELHDVLWKVLTFRDSVVKKISKTIEKIPGLGPLLERLMESIQVFIYTTLEPYLKPLIQTVSSGLSSASAEVIDNHDQYEVFNDPRASDPTHSFLSKDHFNLILNECAGHVAKIIVNHTVNLVIRAWGDTSVNINQVANEILECLFHPDFHNPSSKIQREMLQCMATWIQGQGSYQPEILSRLTKDSVRNHRNVRMAGDDGSSMQHNSTATNYGHQAQASVQNYVTSHIPGFSQAQSMLGQFQSIGLSNRDFPSPLATANDGNPYPPPLGPPTYSAPGSGAASEFYNRQGNALPAFQPPNGPPPAFPAVGYPPGPNFFPSTEFESEVNFAPPPGPPPQFPNAYAPGSPDQFPTQYHTSRDQPDYHEGYKPSYNNYQGGAPGGGW